MLLRRRWSRTTWPTSSAGMPSGAMTVTLARWRWLSRVRPVAVVIEPLEMECASGTTTATASLDGKATLRMSSKTTVCGTPLAACSPAAATATAASALSRGTCGVMLLLRRPLGALSDVAPAAVSGDCGTSVAALLGVGTAVLTASPAVTGAASTIDGADMGAAAGAVT